MNKDESGSKTVKVDFRLRDTEYGWQQRIDKYALSLTPAWFSVLEWLTILAGLSFLQSKTKSVSLAILVIVSLLLLWLYLNAIVYRVRFTGIYPKWSDRTQFVVSLIISGAIASGLYYLARHIIFLIAKLTAT